MKNYLQTFSALLITVVIFLLSVFLMVKLADCIGWLFDTGHGLLGWISVIVIFCALVAMVIDDD